MRRKREARENSYWITKWNCPVHGIVRDSEVYGEEFGPKFHDGCGQQLEETEMQAVRGEEGETVYLTKKRERRKSCDIAVKGKVKYCGYVIGEDITCEQVERLYNFLHLYYEPIEFIQLTDNELHQIAEENKEEWQ